MEAIGNDGNKNRGAEEGTRTPTPLRVHGPEPCASANSATSASDFSLRCAPCGCRAGRTKFYSTDSAFGVKHPENQNTYNRTRSRGRSRVVGIVMANPSKLPPEVVSHLRRLAHDLSNSLETIMQASYLLSQMELEPTGKKWVELIDEAAQDAAHINRELREVLRG